ncbi:hypothetical protein MRB53_003020 [Persea americana]|uniref:Uncharacterized protein n=1 Tax=Persea americana TaxID=3435 RepID=A0ACC2MYI4_PERAE|nr:hypothetical protein MRB53_003020 [Persea americana]
MPQKRKDKSSRNKKLRSFLGMKEKSADFVIRDSALSLFPSLPSDGPILVSFKSESSAPWVVLELGVAADQNCFAPPCKLCVSITLLTRYPKRTKSIHDFAMQVV